MHRVVVSRLARLAGLAGLVVGLGAGVAQAQFTFTWDGGPDPSYNGNWNDAQDWTANIGVPSVFDTAKFDVNQTYNVNIGAPVLVSNTNY